MSDSPTSSARSPAPSCRSSSCGILRHDDALDLGDTPASPSAACPYRGLQPFGVEDEDDFFGRDADIEAALARLGRSRFLAVSGASGSGKSSLVRAGVVPALHRRGDRVVILTPEHDLDARIREAVWSGRADVVIVDQFEEVFHAGEADVDAAARAIAEAAVTGTTVVLVVRSDFLDDCAAHPDLAPLVAEGVHLVGPMAPDALREAIEEPARRAGLRLEPGLVELILRDAAGRPARSPTCRTRSSRPGSVAKGATLTVAGYEASGGISGAIAQSADRLYQSMDARPARDVPLARCCGSWPSRPTAVPSAAGCPSKSLRADAAREQVLSMLARSRLVSAESRLDRGGARVARDRMAAPARRGSRRTPRARASSRRWPRPRRRGMPTGRPDDDLFRGARLQTALEWRDAAPRDLTDVEIAFLDASAALAPPAERSTRRRARSGTDARTGGCGCCSGSRPA